MRHAQLRAFHQVALTGGFSRAAEALNQTQPSISDQVKRLEQTHDVLLFHRDGRQVRLTPAGEALLRLTRRYFEIEGQIAAQLSAARAAVEGTLRIVADSALHLAPALTAFRARHPRVFVDLRTGNTGTVLAALRNYEAEIGVVGSPDTGTDLDRRDLGTTPIVAIAAHGAAPVGPLTLAALTHLPLIFREPGSRTRAALENAARVAGVRLAPAMQVEGREAMREMVAAGAGIGFVSQAELGHDARIVPVELEGGRLAMPEVLVCLAQRRDVPVIRAFLKTAG